MSAWTIRPAGVMRSGVRFSTRHDMIFVALVAGLLTICGMELAQRAGHVGTIWPANGFLLAVLLSARPAREPFYLLVGCLANLAAAFVLAYPVETCLRLVLVNTFEVTVAWALIRRMVGPDCDLSQQRNLWRFALAAVVLAPALAAVLNAVLAGLDPWSRGPQVLVSSYFAHVLGILTATPVALAMYRREFLTPLDRGKAIDTGVAFAILLAITSLVFVQSRYPLLFVIYPPLVLVVFRCGLLGGLLGLFLTTLISIGLTVEGLGPTTIIVNSTGLERIIIVQLFSTVAGGLVLILSAVLAERDRALRDLVAARDELMRLAATDGLTGLHNRRRLDEAMNEECRRAARTHAPLSLLMLDVDRFKAFNDHYGHPSGDECLRALSTTIKSLGRRPGDLVARYGGEELAILLPGTPENGALVLAEAIRAAVVNLAMQHEGNQACGGIVTVSIGVATAAPNALPYQADALIKAADDCLYEAKRTGRNKVLSPSRRPTDPLPPVLLREDSRLVAVDAFQAAAEGRRIAELDDIAKNAADLLGSPIGLVSLVSRDRQIFVGRYGLDIVGTGRDVSFCAHAITADEPLVVPDATLDPRFRANALVTGDFNLRFYAGAPLVIEEGSHHLGALCVIDRVAHRALRPDERAELTRLASVATRAIESLEPGAA